MLPLIRFQDIADILIMSFLVYQLYRWFRNTKTLQVLIGLGSLGVLYVVTKNLGLFMTSWILQELGTVFFILVIVIFQTEIRQALYRFSLFRNLFGREDTGTKVDFLQFSTTVFTLAASRTGALIVFQRDEPLDEYLLHGVPIDSVLSGQLIATIFQNGTPLHDGAVLVKDGRVAQASSHLPLSTNPDLPQHYGTRHRAALGLTERSDAVVVVVSEERGAVSLVRAGEMVSIQTPELLAEALNGLLAQAARESGVLGNGIRQTVFADLRTKALVIVLITAAWLMITGRQGEIITVTAPLRFHNLPENLALIKSDPESVDLQLKVLSSLIPTPKTTDLVADLDLSSIKEGTTGITIRNDDVKLPLGVVVSAVTPATVKVTTDRKISRDVPVKVMTVKRLPGRRRLLEIRVEPESVTVEGPQRVIDRVDAVQTEEVDLSGIMESTTLEKKVIPPGSSVRLLHGDKVRVSIDVSRK
jgi:diadenylate cyclase